MNEAVKPATRSATFRTAITQFIEDRKAAKLKTAGDEDASIAPKYTYTTWLADAARRVAQIQAVTHVLKATHPDARGTSLHVAPDHLPPHEDIGTHVLGPDYADDIVGNAAALDVYKFLKLEIEGRRLLDWLLRDDPDLRVALHDDAAIAQTWAEAFKTLIRPVDAPASHEKAKQIYWCITNSPRDDAGFHLLQPMFSSSLAHAVHRDIQDARFGETNKEARRAKKEQLPHPGIYRDYRNLVARKLGGTKPQNISQLNSDRGGVNYLLASLPPSWDQNKSRPLLHSASALDRFAHFEGVHLLLDALYSLLTRNSAPTMETRRARERIEHVLGESLAAFGLVTRASFEPGWTRDEDCRLPLCEQLWLDPERAELPPREDRLEEDRAFAEALTWKDWPDEVAHRFGHWLNALLIERDLPVGDAEQRHWARQAIIDAEWPAPMQRALSSGSPSIGDHVHD